MVGPGIIRRIEEAAAKASQVSKDILISLAKERINLPLAAFVKWFVHPCASGPIQIFPRDLLQLCLVETLAVAAMDDADRQVDEPAHGGAVVVTARAPHVVDQRVVIDRVARKQQAVALVV